MIGLVERLFFWEEGHIDARGCAQGEIIFQGLRVIREVGDAVELDGIDKDRDRHGSLWANEFAGCTEEFEVSLVQGSHGGDQNERAWHFLQGGPYRVDVSDPCEHLSECQ